MPITVDELERAQRPLWERILAFLAKHPDHAFDLWEIIAGVEEFSDKTLIFAKVLVNPEQTAVTERPYSEALERLVQQGRVRRGVYQFRNYYALARAASPTKP